MAKAKRELVLDVHADCDRVLRVISQQKADSYFEGMGRLLERGESRHGTILLFASPKKGKLRVEIEQSRVGDRLVYSMRGDVKGSVVVTALPRGPRCRVYIEAEGEGRLIELYGGEALGRVINRIAATIISVFPAVLQPRLAGIKLGDVLVEALRFLNFALVGPEGVKASTIKTMAVSLEDGKLVAVDGFPEAVSRSVARVFTNIAASLRELAQVIGIDDIERMAFVGKLGVIYVSLGGGLAILTLLEKTENDRAN